MEEHRTDNPKTEGSNPSTPSEITLEKLQEAVDWVEKGIVIKCSVCGGTIPDSHTRMFNPHTFEHTHIGCLSPGSLKYLKPWITIR